MQLVINQQTFAVELVNNATAQALAQRLPLDLTMQELNGNEKYYYLNTNLPTAAQRVGQIKAGDIMLWQDNCLVIFYQSFATPYAYTRLGHIKDATNLARAVGKGSVRVKWHG